MVYLEEVCVGVDVVTRDAKKLVRRLNRLKGVAAVVGGVYAADHNYSIVWVDGMSEDTLDDWLYRVNHGCEYIGCFTKATGNSVTSESV